MVKNTDKFQQVLTNVKEAIFPSFCVNCGTETDLANSFLCQKCERLINLNKTEICPGCGSISDYSCYCKQCSRGLTINGVYFASRFTPPVSELIHWYKYEQIKSICDYLANMVADSMAKRQLSNNLVITYVPLHFTKILKRGFNQSKDLADIISKKLGIILVNVLIRSRSTRPQMKLKRNERLNNLSGAFTIKNPQLIRGKNILLVDDVMTTGSTLDECAKVLESAGVNKVFGLVVARD